MSKNTRIRLPQLLQDEIDGSNEGSAHSRHLRRKPKGQLSRRDARKQDREDKKKRKAEFYARPSTHHVPKRHADQADHVDSPNRKKAKLSKEAPVAAPAKSSLVPAPTKSIKHLHGEHKQETKILGKPKTALEKLAARTEPTSALIPSRSGTQIEKEEDAYISYLEKKLGGSKGGRTTNQLGSEFEDDGLGDLLTELDTLERSAFNHVQQTDPEDDESSENGDAFIHEDEERLDDDDLSDTESWHGLDLIEAPNYPPPPVPQPSISDLTTPGAKPSPGATYIPPHLRKSSEMDEALVKLTRQLKGLLNRLSEQNIGSILDDIEEMFRKHRRYDVTSTLTTLIIDGISSHSSHLDSYVVLYAAFVSSLHRIIGIEFAAYFLQNVVSSYEKFYSTISDAPALLSADTTPAGQADSEPLGKECSNLIILISELYNFQVISCVLVYDVIRGLLEKQLSEFNVELLLKITRNSGQQLRQDDPSALKDIIQIVQAKVSSKADELSSRTRFMLETLTNLKNNKVKRTAGAPGAAEAVERMKKFLSGLSKKKHVMGHEPLRVTLDDLHSAESKGKWWLVGAAWGGNPLVDRLEGASTIAAEKGDDDISENTLLKLARKQGMNTDIRRSIFVVLMSSDDYVDACERLAQLNLTEVQRREIVRVLLHCCGNEKSYNPFYTLVCQNLCQTSHSYKITLQFCLWDFLRDLGETNVGGAEVIKNLQEGNTGFGSKSISSTRMTNVAKAYAWWTAKDCVTLSIFKPVDFTMLKPQTGKFLKEFFVQLFVSSQVSTPVISKDFPTSRNRGTLEQVFIKATRMETLALGLVYFLTEYFKDEEETGDGSRTKFLAWCVEVAKDTLRTGLDIVPNL